MKKLIIITMFMLAGTLSYGQGVVRDSAGNFHSTKATKAPAQKTGKYYYDSKGRKWEVFMSSSGRYYVNKVSDKTGKTYKYYLTEKQ